MKKSIAILSITALLLTLHAGKAFGMERPRGEARARFMDILRAFKTALKVDLADIASIPQALEALKQVKHTEWLLAGQRGAEPGDQNIAQLKAYVLSHPEFWAAAVKGGLKRTLGIVLLPLLQSLPEVEIHDPTWD